MDKKTLTPKKKRIILAAGIAVLLLTLYLSSYLTPTEAAEDVLAERLEQALSGMQGVGEVRVVINYRAAEEAAAVSAEKEEHTFWEEAPADNEPPAQEVCGVLVVAEGAEDIRVRTEMLRAVAALMDVSMDQIEILY